MILMRTQGRVRNFYYAAHASSSFKNISGSNIDSFLSLVSYLVVISIFAGMYAYKVFTSID
jgi:hypothetical protein